MAESMQTLSDEQLVSRVREREFDLVRNRFAHSQQQLENTARLSEIRKEIARLKTEIRSREIATGLPKGAMMARHGKAAGADQAPGAGQAPAERGGFLKGIVDRLTGGE